MQKKSNCKVHWESYRNLRRQVKSKLRKSHSDYITRTAVCIKDNPKRFWNYVKTRKTEPKTAECLNTNGNIIIDDKEKAEVLK